MPILGMSVFGLIGAVLVAVAAGIGAISDLAGLVANGLLAAFSLAALCVGIEPKEGKEQDAGTVLPMALSLVLILAASFGQVCRHLDQLVGGFTADRDGWWHWTRFGVAWVLESGAFDIPVIFGWHTTTIVPDAIWSKVLLSLFNIVLELAVVAGLWRLWVRYRGSEKKARAASDVVDIAAWLVLAPLLASFVGGLVRDGQSVATGWEDVRRYAPIVLASVFLLHAATRARTGCAGALFLLLLSASCGGLAWWGW